MFKLWATFIKDLRLLFRDKVGLLLMFVMPIVLAILIAAIQNNTFKLVNDNKFSVVVYNEDGKTTSHDFITALKETGLFKLREFSAGKEEVPLVEQMQKEDALIGIVIPPSFSSHIELTAKTLSNKISADLGLTSDTTKKIKSRVEQITVYFSPILQESFRQSINGAVRGAVQLTENKQLIRNLYDPEDQKKTVSTLQQEILQNQTQIHEVTALRNGQKTIPNATQHNIPAWTIFAMFFVVTSLGSSLVKEKLNGSFIRLKTLPTNYMVTLASKQITYLCVTLSQVAVIFAIGCYWFPLVGLPKLNLPTDLTGLIVVSCICGWCAVSYALCIGVFAHTQEQANGFGAVTIVIFAAIGGLLVPSFAMPASFRTAMNLSPLHWCLESYYGLFLEGSKLKDLGTTLFPLIGITLILQLVSLWGLKQQKLI